MAAIATRRRWRSWAPPSTSTGSAGTGAPSKRSTSAPHQARAFHGALLASGRGRFVLVSGKQAQAPTNANAAYAAAKAAAEAWTLALADGFEGGGATANIVVVEAILTAAMRERDPDGDFASFTPAEHLAEAIAFLCSDAAAKMNGQRLRLTMG